jgi:DNA-binding NarL/FixJ family response regulator
MNTIFSGKILCTRVPQLTHRETQILALLMDGLKNNEIARALGITEGTVKGHLSRLFRKVGVRNRFELALFGLQKRRSVQQTPRLTIVGRKACSLD